MVAAHRHKAALGALLDDNWVQHKRLHASCTSPLLEGYYDALAGLVDGGKTILMVTHDDDLAQRVSRTVTIADGQIVDDVKRTRRNGTAHPATTAHPAASAAPVAAAEVAHA